MTKEEKKILIETVPADEDIEVLVEVLNDNQSNIEVHVSE